jgi:ABC-type uncharacterized transport system involved in gliding motility auxiliary subunit
MLTKRSTLGGGALIALALLFIGLTVLFGTVLRGWRVDLTENGLYTTAPGTERILKGLKEPINLYFFYSEKAINNVPELKPYGQRVKELLQEMVAPCASPSSTRSRSRTRRTAQPSSACAARR